MRVESSGKPDAWKLARPVWGWGRGETPRPTPLEGCSPLDNNIVELPDVRGGTHLASVVEYPVWPLEQLAGTETEAALKAAGIELAPPADRTVARRWVLYNADSRTLLTTRTYDSYAEAVENAAHVNDVLALPLVYEEIEA